MPFALKASGRAGLPEANGSETPRLRTALLGCGPWGINLARAAVATGRFDLRAVVDVAATSAHAAKEKLGATWSSTEPQDVWLDDEIEAVLVATPAGSHFMLASEALRAGKHALVEKPLALSVAECRVLGAVTAGAGLVLMVGHTFMYSPRVTAVRAALDAGAIGDTYYMHLQRLAFGRFRDDVNVTWNLGPHDVSILNYWSGADPVAVQCVEHYCTRSAVADVAFLTIDYGTCFGFAHLSCANPAKVRAGTVAGSDGGVTYNDVTGYVAVTLRGPDAATPTPLTILAAEPLQEECRHFEHCVSTSTQPRTDVSHALAVVAVLEAATTSARQGGVWVPVEPSDPPRSSVVSRRLIADRNRT